MRVGDESTRSGRWLAPEGNAAFRGAAFFFADVVVPVLTSDPSPNHDPFPRFYRQHPRPFALSIFLPYAASSPVTERGNSAIKKRRFPRHRTRGNPALLRYYRTGISRSRVKGDGSFLLSHPRSLTSVDVSALTPIANRTATSEREYSALRDGTATPVTQ